MTTIGDLSDTPAYTIKTVCTETGIRPVTLRAWERRYKLLSPHRLANNYRLYSERDVALLRWLKSRVDGGLPIRSAAAELQEMRRTDRWPEPLPALHKPQATATNPPADYAARLFTALVALDESAAGDVLREAHALFDVTTICLSVITPCLVEIGEVWHRGELRIATEHFASTYLRGRLLALFQAYPTPRGAPRIIVGCAPHEQHEIGGLMLALLLRREGYRVEFLGADVEIEDLLDYIRLERPALICLSASVDQSARALRHVHDGLTGMRPRPKFGFGGRAFNVNPALRTAIPGVFLGATVVEACAAIRKLLAA